jgi:serine/threonine protein kinase/LysM repeat protein
MSPEMSSLSDEQQTMETLSRTLAGGRYRLLRLLGAGAMGSVRLAEDTALHRRVAVKTVKEEVARDPEFRKRIERECLLHAKVGPHPHIVTLFDKLDLRDEIHLVMEYVDGETLQARLERNSEQGIVMPPAEAITIAVQVLEALSRIHAHGIVHRDIKPSNIMLTYTESGGVCAKLMDFGVSRMADNDDQLSKLTTTESGGPGTPMYMAPEQIDSKAFGEISYYTDVYAMGILLFQLLSGKPPFRGTLTEVLNGHLNKPLPEIQVRLDGVMPDAVSNLLKQALAKRPKDRIQTAKEFREKLSTVTGLTTDASGRSSVRLRDTATRPTSVEGPFTAISTRTWLASSTVQRLTRYRRSMKVLAGGIAAVLVLLVGSAIWVLGGGGDASSAQTTGDTLQAGAGQVPRGLTAPSTSVTLSADPSALEPVAELPTVAPADADATLLDPTRSVDAAREWFTLATGIDARGTMIPVDGGVSAAHVSGPASAGDSSLGSIVVEGSTIQGPGETATPTGVKEHVVQPGDTLSKVAAVHGVEISDLQWWNGILNPNSLSVGQVLLLHPTEGLPPKEEFMKKAAASRPRKSAERTAEEGATAPVQWSGDTNPFAPRASTETPAQKVEEKPKKTPFKNVWNKLRGKP